MYSNSLLLAFASIVVGLARASTDVVMCPAFEARDYSATVDNWDEGFGEISGLAVSTTQISEEGNPVAFAINDSGDDPRLWLFDSVTGDHLRTLWIEGGEVENVDWESLTGGPCSDDPGDSCLYISDTGDNTARGSEGQDSYRDGDPYRIYRIREPVWEELDDGDSIEVDSVLEFDYKSESPYIKPEFADSESFFVDPVGWGDDGASPGDLYVVTKWDEREAEIFNRVFYIPVSAWEDDEVYSPIALDYESDASFMGPRWTGGEMSPDGTVLALGTYEGTYFYLRCPGASIEWTLKQQHCLYIPVFDDCEQMETVAWMPDGKQILEIPEGYEVPMSKTTLLYEGAWSEQVCPHVAYNSVGKCSSVIDSGDEYPDSWCAVDYYKYTVITLADEPSSTPSLSPSLSPLSIPTASPRSTPTASPSLAPAKQGEVEPPGTETDEGAADPLDGEASSVSGDPIPAVLESERSPSSVGNRRSLGHLIIFLGTLLLPWMVVWA